MHHEQAARDGLELSHVLRPRIETERLDQAWSDIRRATTGVLAEEMSEQRDHVAAALGERG